MSETFQLCFSLIRRVASANQERAGSDVTKLAVISGYASVDFPVRLPLPLQGEQTATVEAMAVEQWPRPGGAALYAARCIAAAGSRATALVTVGNDSNGALYLDAARAGGLELAGVDVSADARTPWCMLLYHDDGGYTCLIDRGDVDRHQLTDSQRSLVSAADFICIAAGSAATNAAVLDGVSSGTPVAWIAKRDPVCFPPPLARRLAERADFIFCNAGERADVDAARGAEPRPHQAIVETRGAAGVRLEHGGRTIDLPVDSLHVRDATGAGDTLAGGVIASLLAGTQDLESAVREGIHAARRLLAGRALLDSRSRRRYASASRAQ